MMQRWSILGQTFQCRKMRFIRFIQILMGFIILGMIVSFLVFLVSTKKLNISSMIKRCKRGLKAMISVIAKDRSHEKKR